jgi:hypothetical protein
VVPDLFHAIGVAHDLKIKSPRIIHASLPQVAGFIVFLGVERRMMQILKQELRLLSERLLNSFNRMLKKILR